MGTLFTYSLSSGIILMALYVIYKWLLAGENQHAYNRTIILCIYVVAFLYVPIAGVYGRLFSPEEPASVIDTDLTVLLQTIASVDEGNAYVAPVYPLVIIALYIAGVVVMTTSTLIVWMRIMKLIARGEKRQKGRYTLVLIDDHNVAPFSWMRYIVMSRDDYLSAGETITLHETKHLQCMHWIDMLAAQAVLVINWFNPAAWLMREELKAIHEYQADMSVLESGVNARQYQLLLIKKAVGARFPSLANSLNHSKLKKRITMMLSSKSSKCRRWRALALVPACAAALAVVNLPAIASVIYDVESADFGSALAYDDKVNDFPEESQILTISDVPKEFASDEVGETASERSSDQAKATKPKSVNNEPYPYYVTGQVVDETGKPIIGAIVKSDDGKRGTATDTEGKFKLESADKNVKFKVMYIGYNTLDISCNNGASVKLTLEPDKERETPSGSSKSSNISVVGYGDMKKSDMTMSISVDREITPEILDKSEILYAGKRISREKYAALSPEIKKTAFVITETDNDNSTTTRVIIPNSDNDKSTVYMIDGKIINEEDLKNLSPDNIKSITVNKKNNVVVIETIDKKSDGSSTTTTVTTTTATFDD
ncbi:MAG TPA: carboxypeptidase-like regulatory domain-containing protein [Muribaculum sp.]|uniref:Carboxypeptidase-like regulatory domain-containing protein n=1 Tax=Heminiphilus faecis TaxID=2601703 RepID=A0ABV4CS14_9BACT|nr:M56 family metallopeptidase [Heminiphilus faecis]RLT76911.1 M56 family peptidase [bacterium J10(2018)]HRF67744.1 carboxypeptidase-like regulatory domain-containing protein [Muribaculum sp.]